VMTVGTPASNARVSRYINELRDENLELRRIIKSLEDRFAVVEAKTSHLADKTFPLTADMVREFRELTGASMMDAKHALQLHRGDFDAAREYIRTRGF
jgi:ribosomal protein L7/L12